MVLILDGKSDLVARERRKQGLFRNKFKKRGVSYFYRTATTSHLCYVPVLEDSEGAGRKRLTPRKYIKNFRISRRIILQKLNDLAKQP